MANYWFDHVHLNSPNPMATAGFYEKMLGARNIGNRKIGDGRTMVDLLFHESSIKIIEPRPQPLVPGAAPYGLDHFGLRTDNIEEAVRELKANGVKFVQEVREAAPGTKVAFFLGPENVQIELLQRSA